MGDRRSFQEAVRTCALVALPSTNFIFIDGDGPEPVSPYCTIEVPQMQAVGREDSETHVSGGTESVLGSLRTIEHYEATARFQFVGRNADGTDAGDLAFDFSRLIATPKLQMKFRENNLSYMRKAIIRRIPKFRETRWYDAYVLDVVFAFCLETTQQIDSVDTIELNGIFENSATTPTTVINVP